MDLEALSAICNENGLRLRAESLHLLAQYAELLAEWNSKINLISRKDEANILERHILHSLTLAMPSVSDYDFANKWIIDIGTGGGLPGIPLKIAVPTVQLRLLDSVQKKIMAVRDMVSQLGLVDVIAMAARAEELKGEHLHAYDAVVTRAVAPLEELIRWSRALRKPNALLLSLKGGDLAEELRRAERLKEVASVQIQSLKLSGFEGFEAEDKKLVCVRFHNS